MIWWRWERLSLCFTARITIDKQLTNAERKYILKKIFVTYKKVNHETEEEIKMSRVYNFSAGPAVLPEEVLQEAADEMLDYKGSGMSVMEMSHRSKTYDNIIKEAEADLRELLLGRGRRCHAFL